MLQKAISELVEYAVRKEWITEEDRIWASNRILEALNVNGFEGLTEVNGELREIQEILNDVEKENMLCVYDFEEVSDYGGPLKILLTRDLPSAIERLNRKPVGSYCLSNTASVLVHEIDPWGEWLIASLNGDDMRVCEITQAEKDDSTSEGNVETGFYYGNTWIPMNQIMRL